METGIHKRRKTIELLLNSITFLIFLWFFYNAFYELFISIPQIHIPRVSLERNIFGVILVDFVLNTPTVSAFINLFVGFISICSSITIYVIDIFTVQKRAKTFWIISIAGFIICFISMLYAMNDFFSNAFKGIG